MRIISLILKRCKHEGGADWTTVQKHRRAAGELTMKRTYSRKMKNVH
jgi:hypothetical protein